MPRRGLQGRFRESHYAVSARDLQLSSCNTLNFVVMKEQKNTSNGMPYGQSAERKDQQHNGQNKTECNDRRPAQEGKYPETGQYGRKQEGMKQTDAPKRSADYAAVRSAKTSESATAAKTTAARSTTRKTTAAGCSASAAKSTAKTTTASAKHPAAASKTKK